MASAAEQLAANGSLSQFAKATDLKKRLWFTLGTLVVFRLLSYVPLPGIDPRVLQSLFDTTKGGVMDFFNTFTGGALTRMSIVALGVMPYITASIVVQLATSLSPSLAAIKKEGESGRKKLNQYTRYGTVLLTAVQAYFISVGLEAWGTSAGQSAVIVDPLLFRFTTVITLVGGTMFLMWLGEQITTRGIGNGVSLIIMSGIIAGLPATIAGAFDAARTGASSPLMVLGGFGLIIGLILIICFMERAQRRVLIQYPKRQTARGMMQADKSHLPLKINTANVIPPIFASSLLALPLTITQFAGKHINGESKWGDFVISLNQWIGQDTPMYFVLYAAGIIFFSFFYTAVVFNPEETADNLKRYGGFIPGIRPGKSTEVYLDYVLTRITVIGAIYLTAICVVPEMFIPRHLVGFGGTSLLIVVNVTIDTVTQIQSHLLAHQYGDLIKRARLKGGVRR
jgi:preprotein translocase subunit SecY